MRLIVYTILAALVFIVFKAFYWDSRETSAAPEANSSIEVMQSSPVPESKKDEINVTQKHQTFEEKINDNAFDQFGNWVAEKLADKL